MSLIHWPVRGFFGMPRAVMRRLAGAPKRSPEGYELDLQIQVLLAFLKMQPEIHRVGVARARRRMERYAPLLDLVVPGVRTLDQPGRRLYLPDAPGPRPVIVFFHGGGWVVGSIASHDGLCRALCKQTRSLVLSVEYRLAPEHPYPAAQHDALAATEWAIANVAQFGGDPSRIAVAGDSAGGSLAATVALRLRERLAFQLLVYPSTDLTRAHPSHGHFADGYLLTKNVMDWFVEQYARPHHYREPLASPLFVDDVRGAPPAFIMTAGFDPLRDEGAAYAEKLRAAGVPVEYRCYSSLIHGFFSMAGAIDAARVAFDDAVSALSASPARR